MRSTRNASSRADSPWSQSSIDGFTPHGTARRLQTCRTAADAAARPRLARARPELRAVEGPHLALDVPLVAVHLEETPGELEGVLHRPRLEDRVAANHLFRLGERAVLHRELPEGGAHTLAFGGGAKPAGRDEAAVLRHLGHELAHLVHQALARFLAGVFLDTDHRKEFHGVFPD